MKKIIITSIMILLTFTLNSVSLYAANTSGNEDWYTESIISVNIENDITYESLYEDTFTFPEILFEADDTTSCNVSFEHYDFNWYDNTNFKRTNSNNLEFIGSDYSQTYTIQVKGMVLASHGFLCLGREELHNQIITVEVQPLEINFYESCSTFDLNCQSEVVSKGVGELPDLIFNLNQTRNNLNTLVGGFPAVESALAIFFISAVITFRKWFS